MQDGPQPHRCWDIYCERAPPHGEDDLLHLIWKLWTENAQNHVALAWEHMKGQGEPVSNNSVCGCSSSPFWNWISTFRYCLSKSITTAFMWPRMPLRYLYKTETVQSNIREIIDPSVCVRQMIKSLWQISVTNENLHNINGLQHISEWAQYIFHLPESCCRS